MNRAQANLLYNANWVAEELDHDQILQRIEKLAESGAYQTHVSIDSAEYRDVIRTGLVDLGYDVEDYCGGETILEISWG